MAATTAAVLWASPSASNPCHPAHLSICCRGTNFGFWAGANVDGVKYLPHTTSYDYDCPISEAGDYCQPGIGGDCKFFVS